DADAHRLGHRALAALGVHEERLARAAAHLALQVAVLAERDVHPHEAREEHLGAAARARLGLERLAPAHPVLDLRAAALARARLRLRDRALGAGQGRAHSSAPID